MSILDKTDHAITWHDYFKLLISPKLELKTLWYLFVVPGVTDPSHWTPAACEACSCDQQVVCLINLAYCPESFQPWLSSGGK